MEASLVLICVNQLEVVTTSSDLIPSYSRVLSHGCGCSVRARLFWIIAMLLASCQWCHATLHHASLLLYNMWRHHILVADIFALSSSFYTTVIEGVSERPDHLDNLGVIQ